MTTIWCLCSITSNKPFLQSAVFVTCLCVSAPGLCFQADADLNPSRQTEKPFSEHLKPKMPGLIRLSSAAMGRWVGGVQSSGLSGFGVTQRRQLQSHLPVSSFQRLPVRFKKKINIYFLSLLISARTLFAVLLIEALGGVLAFTCQHTTNTLNQMSARFISDQTFCFDW